MLTHTPKFVFMFLWGLPIPLALELVRTKNISLFTLNMFLVLLIWKGLLVPTRTGKQIHTYIKYHSTSICSIPYLHFNLVLDPTIPHPGLF